MNLNLKQTYIITNTQKDKIQELSQEGDIILRRFDYQLDSLIVPGYWSHCGIIGYNKNVIHAYQIVQETKLNEFCKTDHVCILRGDYDKNYLISTAYTFIGTAYDWSFSNRNLTLYCTELIYSCLNNLKLNKLFLPKYFKILWKKIILPDSLLNHAFTKVYQC